MCESILNSDKQVLMSPELAFYCECCKSMQEIYPIVLHKDILNPYKRSDIMCKKCSFVIGTVEALNTDEIKEGVK